MTSRCPSVGLRLAKGPLLSVEQKFTIIYRTILETRKVLPFLTRDFLIIFLIHRFFFFLLLLLLLYFFSLFYYLNVNSFYYYYPNVNSFCYYFYFHVWGKSPPRGAIQ